jgi:proteasomal ATPase-associated factor 1
VGQGAEAKKWTLAGGKPVDAMVVVEDQSGLSSLGVIQEDDKVILAASTDGTITAYTLSSDSGSAPLFTASPWSSSKLLSVAYSPASQLLATGHADGTITLRSLESLVANDGANSATAVITRNDARIYSLAFVETQGTDLLVGTASGLPCRLGLDVEGIDIAVTVKEEYAGWEAVGIETWARASDGVWCAGGDNRIRRY